MRRFTMQLHRVHLHEHDCELCGERRQCIDPRCARTHFASCERCLSRVDCPTCFGVEGVHQELKLAWLCDDLDKDGTPQRTCFTSECERCGAEHGFTDLHDGRGPLRHGSTTDSMHCGCHWVRTKEFGDILRQCKAHADGAAYHGEEAFQLEDR